MPINKNLHEMCGLESLTLVNKQSIKLKMTFLKDKCLSLVKEQNP